MKIPISNKEIPPSLFEKASAAAGNEEILFAICGDLDSGSRYSESLLLATKSKVISLDGENAEVFSASFEEIEDAAVKRMYGNAVLSVKIGGKRKNIFRCTYACASHAEAATVFICAASSGKDFSDELGALEDSFESGYARTAEGRCQVRGRYATAAPGGARWFGNSGNISARSFPRLWSLLCFHW